jgi:hypothetical protein
MTRGPSRIPKNEDECYSKRCQGAFGIINTGNHQSKFALVGQFRGDYWF